MTFADWKLKQFRWREERIQDTEDGLKMLRDNMQTATRENNPEWAKAIAEEQNCMGRNLKQLQDQKAKIGEWLDQNRPGWRGETAT